MHPDWNEQHVGVSQWEVLEHEGNSLVFAVVLAGGSAAAINTTDGKARDSAYVCAIYRCFHLFVLALHDTRADLLFSDLPPATKTGLAADPIGPQDVIGDLKGRLLRFSSSINLGRRDYTGHIRRAECRRRGDATVPSAALGLYTSSHVPIPRSHARW